MQCGWGFETGGGFQLGEGGVWEMEAVTDSQDLWADFDKVFEAFLIEGLLGHRIAGFLKEALDC